jgi:drug/metabolite transporter (DMT)-like permease
MVSVAVIFGLVIALCFGTADFLSKGLTKEVGSYRTTVYTLTMSGIFVIVPSLFFGLPNALSLSDVGLLALVALSTFAAFFFMYRGYQRGNLSVVSPTVNSFPIFSVAFAVVILKVSVSAQVMLALAGVIAGIILVSTNISAMGASRGRSITPGVPDAILAAFFFALGFTTMGYADEKIGYLLPVVSARFGAASIGFLVGASLKKDMRPFGGRPLLRVSAMGALEAGGLLAFSLALFYSSTIGALPIVTTLSGMGVVITVGLALIFLKEKVEPNYAVGIAILTVSVGALLYLTA